MKKKTIILVLLIVLVLVGLYIYKKNFSQTILEKNVPTKITNENVSVKGKTFLDEATGISFQYSDSLVLQKEQVPNSDLSSPYCPLYSWVRLEDPNGRKIKFEAQSAWLAPSVTIMIHKANCNPDTQDNLSANQLKLRQSLPQFSFGKNVVDSLVALTPVYGDTVVDQSGVPVSPSQNIWKDQCESVSVNASVVSVENCLVDGGIVLVQPNTEVERYYVTKKFIPLGNFIIQISYGRDFFTDAFIESIRNSFKM